MSSTLWPVFLAHHRVMVTSGPIGEIKGLGIFQDVKVAVCNSSRRLVTAVIV
jgi:hypothetical protein